jgi:uncharacterized membrane protein YoaK (UPF0700 family)
MSRSLTRILLMLTFVTGIIDAVSFLALGQVFAAMQTGNVIFLGLGVAGADGAPVAAPLIALTAFVIGGGIAAGLARSRAVDAAGPAMTAEVALLVTAAIVLAASDVRPGDAAAYATIGLLSLAMGLRNTIVRGFGGPNLATTVLNLTLTALTSPAPLSIASGDDLSQRAAAFVAILAGAVSGALLLQASPALAIATAAAITFAAGLAHLRLQAVTPG